MLGAMTACFVLSLSCLGYGAASLQFLRWKPLHPSATIATAFGLGLGIVGWLLFWLATAHQLTTTAVLICLLLGWPGLWFLPWSALKTVKVPEDRVTWLLLAALSLVAALGFVQILVPPTDADSLAYHYALPKIFLASEGLVFQPRAIDGAVPLLPHLTYAAALALGGEAALSGWALVTSLMLGFATFALARLFLNRAWALSLALACITTPAVVYGGAGGQVEVRMALMCVVLAISLLRLHDGEGWRMSIIAGLATGFLLATKYTGIFLALPAGILIFLVAGKRSPGTLLAFGLASLAAGFQWYWWNWTNSGDPVFPMLYGKLAYQQGLWNDAVNLRFKAYLTDAEQVWVPNLSGFLLHPWAATFSPPTQWEAGRTGFGPLPILLLPLAALGSLSCGNRKAALVLALALMFYALWFFIPSSQRIRHLVPVFPLVLVSLTALGWQAAVIRRPLALAIGVSTVIGIFVTLLFYAGAIQALIRGDSREAFLRRTLSGYDIVPSINHHLGPGDRLLSFERQLNFYMNTDYLFAPPHAQAMVDYNPDQSASAFLGQLRRNGVTHLLVPAENSDRLHPLNILAEKSITAGCAADQLMIHAHEIVSRTLSLYGNAPLRQYRLIRIIPDGPGCHLAGSETAH